MTISQKSYLKKTDCQEADPRAPRPVETFVIVAMVLSLFGPYLVGGVRADQLVVYGLAAVVIPLRLPFMHMHGAMRFLAPWAVLVLISLLGVIEPLRVSMKWGSGGVFAGLDNLVIPLAVMLTVLCSVSPSSAESLLRKAGKLYVWGMTINAFVAILDTRYDLSTYLRPFWAREATETTVAIRAEAMGRLSGIINQPSSAGLAYSLAGLLAIYLYMRKPKKLYLIVAFITLGGLLTVSKVFILIGVPLILLYMWRSRSGMGKTGMLLGALIAVGAVVQSGFLQGWEGLDMLTRLIAPPEQQSLVGFYTAGRWVEDSPMMTVITESLRVSPLYGVGAGGWEIAYDSSWAQTIVVSGLLGVVCLAAVLIGLFRLGKRTLDAERRRFTFFLAWLMLASSFGLPALTTNRIGAIVWLVIALLALAHREVDEDKQEEPVTATRRRSSSLR